MESTPICIQHPSGNEASCSSASSLLTLVDMALALELPQVDHTYALHGDNVPKFSDSECLIQKEKDHNYASCSKKGKIQTDVKTTSLSSSEENLTNMTSSSAPARIHMDYIPVNRKSKKSHSLERVESTEHCNQDSTSWLNDNADSSVLCSSWPKQNNFGMLTSKKSGTRTYVDHTYARENGCHCDDMSCTTTCRQENSNFELLSKLSINTDHAYSDTNKSMKKVSDHVSSSQKEKSLPNNSSSSKFSVKNDHAYFDKHFIPPSGGLENTRNLTTVRKSCKSSSECSDHNYYNGSVESLDMDLSGSDTDSCDETAQEETRLAFTAWCQLRKDHPYSSF